MRLPFPPSIQLLLTVVLLPVFSRAATVVCTGREPGFFTDWHRAVIVARVSKAATGVEGVPNSFHMQIEPLATLAGAFDPSEHASVDVVLVAGTINILSVPEVGDVIMVVIEDGRAIVAEECEFMPGNHALVVLKGLGEPVVQETLKKIRDARAHPSR